VFGRIRRTLDGVGLSFNHVVDNTVYLTDIWQQRQVDGILPRNVSADPPAANGRRRAPVARAGLVEMMMTAAGR
jgi:enamine deaminase RidA (YjgF/YER057c/UK114 family)